MSAENRTIETNNIPDALARALSRPSDEEWFIADARGGRRYKAAEVLAAAFHACDFLRGQERVCVMLDNSFELLALYLGALLAGVTVIPIDPLKGEADKELIIAMAGAPKVIQGGAAQFLRDATVHPEASPDHFSFDPSAPYLISYTSGSTGTPKGVVHSFRNLFLSADAFRERLHFGPQNVFYHNLPMTYMAGILNLFFLPLISGSRIVLGERFSAAAMLHFWETPMAHGANTFWFIPTILAMLLKLDRGEAGAAYAAKTRITGLVGTAPLSPQLRHAWEAKYRTPLYESYGLSETLFVATNSPDHTVRDGSVGMPMHGVSVTAAPDQELLLDVPWMFLGYAEEGGAIRKPETPFPSGDLGEIVEDGTIAIVGRKKDIIIRGGVNVSPKRLEDILETMPAFAELAVIGAADTTMGEKIVCFFVPGAGWRDGSLEEAKRSVSEKLGQAYHVDEWIEREDIPRTINGKLDRPALRAFYRPYDRAH